MSATWDNLTRADHLASASFLTRRARSQRRRGYDASASYLERRANEHREAAGRKQG